MLAAGMGWGQGRFKANPPLVIQYFILKFSAYNHVILQFLSYLDSPIVEKTPVNPIEFTSAVSAYVYETHWL